MKNHVEHWFAELKRVWIDKDIEGVRELLSNDFEYFENPFAPPLTSWETVREAWQGIRDQNISRLEIVSLLTEDSGGMAMYELTFEDGNGIVHDVRGSYYVRLDSLGKATGFRRWKVVA
ncbi:MAG: hypothetical protein HGA31_01980 [Candidatus Moranbacteria bacterium]|nr:hypothetical protein [Candidatus Moranbacteria bacterium]